MAFVHTTVLAQETVTTVAQAARTACVAGEGLVVDCTLGGGGHSAGVLAATQDLPGLQVVGIDRDPAALAAASERLDGFGPRFVAVHGQFGQFSMLLQQLGLLHDGAPRLPLVGVIADLGVSSPQFDEPERGFSFRFDGPLDMRMDPSQGLTAAELLAQVKLEDLADVLYQYGDITRSIGTARIVLDEFGKGATTTALLAQRLAARLKHNRSMHPATQVFQALRIWVNREYDELNALLDQVPWMLADDGALALITFHSGEDRPVKQRFAELARSGAFALPVRRGVVPSDSETQSNVRARSARLRVLVRGEQSAAGRYFATRRREDDEDGEADEEEIANEEK